MTALARQAVRFAAVGVVNTAIGLAAIYALMFFWGAGPALANAFGYATGLAVSFGLNRSWTFGSSRPLGRLLPKFGLVVAGAYLLNLAAVLAATSSGAIDPYTSQLLGIGIYTLCMFIGCRWFAFAPEPAA